MTMVGIPPAIDTDVEDVVWALQTAASLWKRNERVDAIVWLRRAAQAAGDAQHDDRAVALARGAAELSDWIAKNPVEPESSTPSSIPPNDSATGGVDDLLRASIPDIPVEISPQVSMSAMTEPHAFRPVQAPELRTPAPPPEAAPTAPLAPTTADLIPIAESSSVAVYQSVTAERSSENVQSAAEVHAGMLDPWSSPTEEDIPAVASVPQTPLQQLAAASVVSGEAYDEEVVTSAKLELPPAEPAVVMAAPNLPQVRPPPRKPPPAPPARTPPPESIESDALESVATSAPPLAPSQVPTRLEVPSPELRAAAKAAEPEAPAAPEPPPPRKRKVARVPPEPTLVSPGVQPPPPKPKVTLGSVDALADLPDDARAELERVATLHELSREEETMGFALAYVVEGELDVAAQIVDAPADRIAKGAVLKAKGTVAESVPLRLVCASDRAVVATWDAEQIEPAFRACPWVEDDLRAAANRMQALVGVTLGPLAERLDAALRAQVTSKLELRELPEGEVIVERGDAVRELCLVGQGALELVDDGKVVGEVGVGEFLFPAEIVAGGKAGTTARAGKGGVLLLAGDRAVAQELMVTCPPLLEIFAGM
jgi:hypothetical protein